MEFGKLKIDKEQVMKGLNVGKRIGKAIVIRGIQTLAVETATKVIKTSFGGNFEDVKKISLDDIIGEEKPKDTTKKSWFSRKKKVEAEELLEEVGKPVDTSKFEEVKLEDVELVTVGKKK